MPTSGLRLLQALALLLIPLSVGMIALVSGDFAPAPFGPQQMVLNVIEVLAIAILAVLVYRRLSLLNAVGIAVILAALRALACGIAAAAGSTLVPNLALSPGAAFLVLWTGAVEVAATQIVLQMLVGIPFFGVFFPRLVGERGLGVAGAGGEEEEGGFAGRRSSASHRAPAVSGHGTLAFDSYEEMDAVLARTRDLLGYALASTEGLIVLADGRRLPFPLMATVPRLQVALSAFQSQEDRGGVSASDVWQFSPEYTTVMCSLRPCFVLLLFFPSGTAHEDLYPRVGTIRRSVEAFLMDRHRLLRRPAREAA